MYFSMIVIVSVFINYFRVYSASGAEAEGWNHRALSYGSCQEIQPREDDLQKVSLHLWFFFQRFSLSLGFSMLMVHPLSFEWNMRFYIVSESEFYVSGWWLLGSNMGFICNWFSQVKHVLDLSLICLFFSRMILHSSRKHVLVVLLWVL